jgi:hypothetical protein
MIEQARVMAKCVKSLVQEGDKRGEVEEVQYSLV